MDEGNLEIEEALKDFEEKAKTEEVEKIPEVAKVSKVPKMVAWVIKLSGGALKDEREAEYVLLGFVIIMFALAAYLFFSSANGEAPVSIDASKIDQRQFVR